MNTARTGTRIKHGNALGLDVALRRIGHPTTQVVVYYGMSVTLARTSLRPFVVV